MKKNLQMFNIRNISIHLILPEHYVTAKSFHSYCSFSWKCPTTAEIHKLPENVITLTAGQRAVI